MVPARAPVCGAGQLRQSAGLRYYDALAAIGRHLFLAGGRDRFVAHLVSTGELTTHGVGEPLVPSSGPGRFGRQRLVAPLSGFVTVTS
jgi:hypothetical protein